MENYSNKSGQGQSGQSGQSSQVRTMEKYRDDNEGKVQEKIKQGKEQAGELIRALNKQVRNNPWPAIAVVAVGSFLLASLINRSK